MARRPSPPAPPPCAGLAGRRLVEQHERRRDAGRGDGRRSASGLSLPLTSSAGDVDDAGELADAVEEDREVVVGALELEVIGHSACSCLVTVGAGLKLLIVRLDCVATVCMRRSRSAASFSSGSTAFRLSSRASSSATCARNSGSFLAVVEPLVDVGAQRRELRCRRVCMSACAGIS